jgi:hypothetical protein
MKPFYASKIFWLGVIEILIGILGHVATFLQAGEYSTAAWLSLTAGALTIILRFLTKEPIYA